MKIMKDVSYGTDPLQKLDIYKAETENAITVVYIHGGGWSQGDKHKEVDLATRIVQQGFSVCVPNYRLAVGETKTHLFPTQRDDVFTAIEWLLQSGHEVSLDRLVVWGSSAGGNLATEVGIHFKIPVINWSGLNALDVFIDQHQTTIAKKMSTDPNTPSALIDQDGEHAEVYKWAVTNLFGGDFSQIKEANPIYRVNQDTKPMFIANSTHELVPLSELYELQKALAEHDVAVQTLILPGSQHAEGYLEQAFQPSIQFIKSYFEQQSTA